VKFEEYTSITQWMEVLANRAEGTRSNYRYYFSKFCEMLSLIPDKVLAKRIEDLKSEDRHIQHHFETQLKKFYPQFKSYGAQQTAYAAVRSFFACHYVELKMLRSDAPTGENMGKRIPEKSEIRAMMDHATSIRDRAVISFAKDIGWRLSDICRLKWGDKTDMGDGFWSFQILTKKMKARANGFMGPETTRLMEAYKKSRGKGTKKIPPEIITDETPLFAVYGGRRKDLQRVRSMNQDWLTLVLGKIARRVGLENVSGHSLRKYFQSTLEKPELHIQKTWIKQMMGKKLNPSDKPYVENRTRKLFEAYRNAYPALCIHETQDYQVRLAEARILTELEHLAPHLRSRMLDRIKETMPMNVQAMIETSPRILEVLQQARKEDEEDCQRVVEEDELTQYLTQGWKVQAVLPSGKIVISNE
jgi:integrase